MVRMQAFVIHFRLAQELSRMGLVNRAIAEFDNLLQYVPETIPVLREQALLNVRKGDWTAAADRLTRALKIDASNPDVRFDMAGVLDKQGKTDDALKLLEDTVAASPNHANSWFLLGVFKSRLRDKTGAIASLERAIECNPVHDRALFMLGNLQLGDGDFASAKRYLLKALDAAPTEALIRVGLGKVYIHEKDWTSAEQHLRQAVEIDPQSADAQFQLGLALSGQGKSAEAIKCFGATLRIDANYPGAIEALQGVSRRGASVN
jgi:tetratricopeptide (TPR) repeat protein